MSDLRVGLMKRHILVNCLKLKTKNYFIILIEWVFKNIILKAKYGIKAIYMKVLIGLKTYPALYVSYNL